MAAPGKSQLVEQHLKLVESIARKLKRTLGAQIELDDLVGYGSKGLVEAAERFDPRHGVAFSTFAYYRIRGAMFDGLRTMGWYSRTAYARFRAEERANEYLRNQAERAGALRTDKTGAPADEPAPAAQILAEVAGVLSGVAAIHITSLEAAARIADERLPPPDAALDGGRLGRRAREAIQRLPDTERRLMELYYFGNMNLEEAGAQLGLSKSWACRLHARAVDLLRQALADML